MIIDPISDLLTRLRNAYMARIRDVAIPFSKLKADLLRVLKRNKYILDYEVKELDNNKKSIYIKLNNISETLHMPTFIRVSKPGQRIYIGTKDIRKSKNGKGIYVVSTSKGIMTGYEARALNVGGEIMCEVF